MKRKMHALNKLAGGSVSRIIIGDGRTEHPVRDALAGGGGSRGQGRMPGNGSTSGDGESRNWGFVFRKGKTLNEYARQLDFFDIELGVLMPDNKLVYVTDLAENSSAQFQADLRQLGSLSGAGLTSQDDNLVLPDLGCDLLPSGGNGKFRRILWCNQGFAPSRSQRN